MRPAGLAAHLHQPHAGVLFGAGQIEFPALRHEFVACRGVRARAVAPSCRAESDGAEPTAGAGGPPRTGVAHRLGNQELEEKSTPLSPELRLRTATSGRRAARDKFPVSATS